MSPGRFDIGIDLLRRGESSCRDIVADPLFRHGRPAGAPCAQQAALRQGADARGAPFPAPKSSYRSNPNLPSVMQHDDTQVKRAAARFTCKSFRLELSYVLRDLEGGGYIEVEHTAAGENLRLTPSGFEREKSSAKGSKRRR